LILSLLFPPDRVSTALIVGDLASDLVSAGHRVTVITTKAHYNPDPAAPHVLRRWLGPIVQCSEWHGAPVYHCIMPAKSAGVLHRVSSWLLFHVLSTIVGAVCARHVDLIFAPSPPLSIGLSAWLLSLVHRAPFVYNVQEIYPDIALKLGRIREGAALRALRRLERFVYRVAAALTVIGPSFKQQLCAKGVRPEKVHVIPNFVDMETHQPLPKDNPFSRQWGIESVFVVSYAGNIGPAQGIDWVLDACVRLRDEVGLRFVFAGEGTLRAYLNAQILARGLTNCLSLPYQDPALMPQLYAASDMSLVPLAPEAGFDAIPSKVYRIMACGRPVIAMAESQSDLATLVNESGGGWVVRPADAEALASVIRQAVRSPEAARTRGVRGREHVMNRYSRRRVTSEYQALFEHLIKSGNRRVETTVLER